MALTTYWIGAIRHLLQSLPLVGTDAKRASNMSGGFGPWEPICRDPNVIFRAQTLASCPTSGARANLTIWGSWVAAQGPTQDIWTCCAAEG